MCMSHGVGSNEATIWKAYMFERYAIFYTPDDPGFAAFGAQWLGWDSAAGASVKHPVFDGLDVAELTKAPRKYGLHATLKAPFRLAEGAREEDLINAVDIFSASQPAAQIEGLELAYRHGFLALRPAGNDEELGVLAGNVVRAFEPLRAPLNETDIARRRKSTLSERQDAQMLKWGYPYVFQDFHFHMTLSGRISIHKAQNTMPVLQQLFVPVAPHPFIVRSVSVMGEDACGMFHQIHRAQLSG